MAPDIRVSLTPRAAEIALAARELLEAQGADSLSMRNIAAQLGIRAASLYEHFADKRAVEDAVIAAGMFDQGDFISARVAADPSAPRIPVIAGAFHDFALEHPALYQLIMGRDLDRTAPDVAAAEQYSGSEIRQEVGEFREISLALWAFAHGMVDLEINERFPPGYDVDAVWKAGLDAFQTELDRKRAAATA